MLVNVLLQHLCQLLGQSPGTQMPRIYVPIDKMALEILILFVQCHIDFDFVIDIFLGPVLYAHVAEPQWNLLVEDHL